MTIVTGISLTPLTTTSVALHRYLPQGSREVALHRLSVSVNHTRPRVAAHAPDDFQPSRKYTTSEPGSSVAQGAYGLANAHEDGKHVARPWTGFCHLRA